jgi:hypothetical protein
MLENLRKRRRFSGIALLITRVEKKKSGNQEATKELIPGFQILTSTPSFVFALQRRFEPDRR